MIMDDTNLKFNSVQKIYENNFKKIQQGQIVIIGLGGVGSWAAEAVVRSGVNHIVLIDADEISLTNVSRQLMATTKTIGRFKADVLKERLLEINPLCVVDSIVSFFNEDFIDLDERCSLLKKASYVFDATDSSRHKCLLINFCHQNNIPLIVSGASGGLRRPERVTIDDLEMATYDNLLSRIRKELRRDFSFPRGERVSGRKKKCVGIKVIYSLEWQDKSDEQQRKKICDSLKVGSKGGCSGTLGALCFVTATFGMMAASEMINFLAQEKENEEEEGPQNLLAKE